MPPSGLLRMRSTMSDMSIKAWDLLPAIWLLDMVKSCRLMTPAMPMENNTAATKTSTKEKPVCERLVFKARVFKGLVFNRIGFRSIGFKRVEFTYWVCANLACAPPGCGYARRLNDLGANCVFDSQDKLSVCVLIDHLTRYIGSLRAFHDAGIVTITGFAHKANARDDGCGSSVSAP